jgi:molybdopterin-synthase adenylyltransferase
MPNEPPESASPIHIGRYKRQMQFAPIGNRGQELIEKSHVAIVGVGALGSTLAERIARMGVGKITLIDRDWVEWDNLPRQTLFCESDVTNRLPKSVAAADRLTQICSECEIVPIVEDIVPGNAERLLSGADLILDGTDNFETRFLINDWALKHKVPWIHGGCVGASGQVMAILPGETACFRCLLPELPGADGQQTCDTVGVIGPAVMIIAAWQSLEAIKILSGNASSVTRDLICFDFWTSDTRKIKLDRARTSPSCPACQGEYDFLSGKFASLSSILCGKNAVQIQPQSGRVDLAALSNKLKPHGTVESNPFLVRFTSGEFSLTVFGDGRAIVSGTQDPAVARSVYSRWIGA